MSTEPGGEAAVVENTPAAHEAAVSSPEGGKTAERDYEAEAAEQGWRPQDEWTGKPENWKDAKTYVEYGEVNNRVFKVEKEYADRFKKLESVTAKTIERLQAAHDKEVAALKTARKEAIKAGDADEVERIEASIEELNEAAPASEKPKPENGTPVAGSPEHIQLIRDFNKSNPWMIEEPEMGEYAEKFSERNAAANEGITFEENMKATEAAVRKKYPNYFNDNKTPAANGHAAVDGGGFAPGAQRTDPLSKLPNEARAQAKSDMTKFPKIYPNAEAWIRAYNS